MTELRTPAVRTGAAATQETAHLEESIARLQAAGLQQSANRGGGYDAPGRPGGPGPSRSALCSSRSALRRSRGRAPPHPAGSGEDDGRSCQDEGERKQEGAQARLLPGAHEDLRVLAAQDESV